MSKVVKAVTGIFGGRPDVGRDIAANASRIGGAPTPEELAEQRAALAAQGRRPKEEELRRQRETGTRPLQGGESTSSFWT